MKKTVDHHNPNSGSGKPAQLRCFLFDESGQTTTEYILILAVIVTIFMQFRTRLLRVVSKLFGALDSAATDATDFNGDPGV